MINVYFSIFFNGNVNVNGNENENDSYNENEYEDFLGRKRNASYNENENETRCYENDLLRKRYVLLRNAGATKTDRCLMDEG